MSTMGLPFLWRKGSVGGAEEGGKAGEPQGAAVHRHEVPLGIVGARSSDIQGGQFDGAGSDRCRLKGVHTRKVYNWAVS
ncbi:hypothetical protein CEXT_243801 [Caerostris extrusa]|uniref:Uncharacterized protein n=1 Tax=Caerostris extrusa TaxID=172846 RepID=A0AAV4TDG9_CAEEX|nr:hypothetical protein CEXT_243801 [Caerostris extrusa]